MSTFPQKLQNARITAHLTQTELAEKIGMTRRSIFGYENGTSVPRPKVLRRLAEVLGVTEMYLTHDDCDDPDEGRAREENINMVRERFGARGAAEAADLLDRNSAFFAGGEVPQEDKDAFFQAIMTAYVTAKEEARRKFTPDAKKSSAGE